MAQTAPRVLYIHPGPEPPSPEPWRNALWYMSRHLRGDVLTTTWMPRSEYRRSREALSASLGSFAYHAVTSWRLPNVLRTFLDFVYFVITGLWLSVRAGRFDVIVAYGPFKTGVAGWLLSRITRVPWILELPGDPSQSFVYTEGLGGRIRARIARFLLPRIIRSADRLRLLYPSQVAAFGSLGLPPASIFHEFTPVSHVPRDGTAEDLILFLGYPWYLKGVDVLLRAFNKISPRFPDWQLLVVGHCPDRRPFEQIAAGNPKVRFERGLPHEAAMDLMSRCGIFVLPSRTEAMGRVLLEAAAAGKPIIASKVGGIPHYFADEQTALLFRPNDVDDLARQLSRLIEQPELGRSLARAARDGVERELNETEYARRFAEMIYQTIGAARTQELPSGAMPPQ